MVNKIILIGNVGNDPEFKSYDSGKQKATFPLATSRKYKDSSGEKKEDTQWHNCEVWGKLADVVKDFVKKGDRLYCEGEVRYESYEKDGEKKYITKVAVQSLQMLGSKGGNSGQGQAQSQPQTQATTEEAGDGLPF